MVWGTLEILRFNRFTVELKNLHFERAPGVILMQMPTKHNSKNYDNILRSPELFLEVSREWMDEQMDG